MTSPGAVEPTWAISVTVDGWLVTLAPVRGAGAPYRVGLVRPDGEEVASKVGAKTVEDAVESAVTWLEGLGQPVGFHARKLLVCLSRDVGGAFPEASSMTVTLTRTP